MQEDYLKFFVIMGQFEDLELADKIFYPLLVIFGLPANVLTIIVLVRQRRAPGGAKSTSSLYLIALAVADSLVLIFIVLIERVVKITILDRQVSFGGFCPWLITLDYTASNASTWIIIAYTIERFTGVYYPVWKHKVCKPVTTKLIIAGVFVLSWLCSLPHFFAEEARSTTKSTKYLCDWKDELSRGYKLALIWGQSFLSYILPYILIITMNGLLIRRLRRWKNARDSKARMTANVLTRHQSNNVPRITISTERHFQDFASVSSERPRRLQPCFEANCDDCATGRESRSLSRVNSRDSQQPPVHYVRADSVVTRRRRNKPVYVLLGVSVAFVVLWLPRFVSFLVLRLSPHSHLLENFSLTLAMDISNMIALSNSAINIFLYSFVDEKFRADLRKLLKCCHHRKISNDINLPPPSHESLGVAATQVVNNTVSRPSVMKSNHDGVKMSVKRVTITQKRAM